MCNNSTSFLFFKILKLKELNSVLQYTKGTKYSYNDACFTFMCSFAQSIFFPLKVWLQLAVNQLSRRFCLLWDVEVLIFCLINKWNLMGPTHFILWLNLFNLFTANSACWLWSNSGWIFNSRGLNRPDSQKPFAHSKSVTELVLCELFCTNYWFKYWF